MPPDYLQWLISQKKPIIGSGGAMLIEAKSFKEYYNCKWAFCNLDDYCMKAYAYTQGLASSIWEGKGDVITPFDITNRARCLQIGRGYYEIGYPLWIEVLSMLMSIKNIPSKNWEKSTVRFCFLVIVGHLSMLGKPKVTWSKKFQKKFSSEFFFTYKNKFFKKNSN